MTLLEIGTLFWLGINLAVFGLFYYRYKVGI